MIKSIIRNLPKWINNYGIVSDVIISSRIRIARNIDNIKFPTSASIDEKKLIIDKILDVFKKSNLISEFNLTGYNLLDLNDLERNALVELHMLSPLFIKDPYYKYFFIDDDGEISIMINEEDHLRIQCLKEGFSIKDVITFIYKIVDKLEDYLDFSYRNDFGYITTCPTNLGTGLRISILCHLPFLNYSGKIRDIISDSSKFSISFKGSFGEGSNPVSSLYQISNSTTLGKSEEDILNTILRFGNEIIRIEREERKNIMDKNRSEILDKIGRSVGVIKYSNKIDLDEANEILSWLRVGAIEKLLNVPVNLINQLIFKIRPNLMKIEFNTTIDEEIDKLRSDYLKTTLGGLI